MFEKFVNMIIISFLNGVILSRYFRKEKCIVKMFSSY